MKMLKRNVNNTIKSGTALGNKQVKTIRKELLINGGDLDLYLDLFLTDENGKTERIFSKKGDSITANFLRILYSQMGRDIRDNVMGGTFYRRRSVAKNVSSISSGTESVFRLTFSDAVISSGETAGKVALGGFQGITLAGIYDYTRVSDSVIEITGTTYSAGWTSGTGVAEIFVPITNFGRYSYNAFKSSSITIGSGTTPTAIDDFCVEEPIPNLSTDGGLTYNSGITSQDTNDATSAQITFTRTFTNNASLTVSVNEIALWMQAGTSQYVLMAMRDIIPGGVTVAAGKTLTVNYRVITTLGTGTDPGGFLASFMRLLYRQTAQATRAIFDINNTSRELGASNASFQAVKAGGFNVEYNSENEYGYKHGIVVGTGDTPVSMADYYLEAPIEHGSGTGEMLYYGGFAENFEVGEDYAQFDIMKTMENNSGNTISIKEYALVGASENTTGTSDSFRYAQYLYMLTRNVLTTPESVPDQTILKVIYTVRVLITEESS